MNVLKFNSVLKARNARPLFSSSRSQSVTSTPVLLVYFYIRLLLFRIRRWVTQDRPKKWFESFFYLYFVYANPWSVSTSKLVFPSVRKLLSEYNINEKDLPKELATGPRGALLKGDLLKFIKTKGLKPSPATPKPVEKSTPKTKASVSKPIDSEETPFTDIDTGNMRRVIAERLTESKQKVPHAYISQDIQIDKLVALRKKLVNGGVKVSINDFIIRASALTLRSVPEANCTWNTKDNEVNILENVDISVAVAIEGGLITPVIRDANTKGIVDISVEMKELATKAKEKKLLPHEYQGGSFSISNLGMFGISNFIAVINPPQSMILAVGGTIGKVNLVEGEGLVSTSHMNVTLSYDSRAVDPYIAGQWLSKFKSILENPATLMV